MDSRVWVRGRLQADPVEMDGSGAPGAAFVVENEQATPGRNHQQTTQVVPWCDVICEGKLASNVLDSLVEGDYVVVEGELRVHRLHPLDDGRDSAMVSVRAETVALDLGKRLARSPRAIHAANSGRALRLVDRA